MKLGDIYPYYNNPRNNSDAVNPVMESLKKFGFIKPIMVDKDMVIICGHTRYIAAFQAGCEYVPVIVSDMPAEQAKRFRILDNKIAERSQFDENELIEELRKMKAPEEMQAFFFEDINTMLNFSLGQFEQQAQEAGGFTNIESYASQKNEFEGSGQNNESSDSYNNNTDTYQETTDDFKETSFGNEVEDPAKDLFVVQMRNDATKFMKVVCPYCGHIEEIDLD